MNNFVIADPNKCIGCRTCEIACVVAHSEKNIFTEKSNDIEFYPCLSVVKTSEVSAPIQCRQCEDAPCANVCPKGSIINKDGVVYIDKKTCIGCKTCLMACPFGVIRLVPEYKDEEKIVDSCKLHFKKRMVANKCDLCIGREKGPACAEVCPTNAFKIVKSTDLNGSIKEKRKRGAQELSSTSLK